MQLILKISGAVYCVHGVVYILKSVHIHIRIAFEKASVLLETLNAINIYFKCCRFCSFVASEFCAY